VESRNVFRSLDLYLFVKKMKKLKYILTVSLFLFCINSIFSQRSVNEAYLEKNWKILNTDENYKITFNNSRFITTLDGSITIDNAEYYLFGSIQSFNEEYVGTDSRGQYLITRNQCYLINFISVNKFTLKPLKDAPRPETITLEAF